MQERLQSPTPVHPEPGARLDDAEVTFQWKPVEEAQGYRLQLARDASWEDVLLSTRVGSRDSLTAGGVLPRDESTIYWRVQALAEDGAGPYSEARSFVSASVPETSEPETAREGREHEEIVGVNMSSGATPIYEIWLFIFAIAASLALIMVAAWQLVGISPEPEGTLTQEEVMDSEFEAAVSFDQYAPIEGEEGVYRIPLDRAIDLTLEDYQQMLPSPEQGSQQAEQPE